MKVFVSHSTADRWVARKVAEDLERLGLTVFLDEKDIQTGDSIDTTITKHLAESDHFLILLSPASVNSQWVLVELGGAIALGKHLVPVLLYLGTNDIPKPIARYRARDISDIERYYEEVLKHPGKAAAGPTLPAPQEPQRRQGVLRVGAQVRLPITRPTLSSPVELKTGWDVEMDPYLGKTARVTKRVRDSKGSILYRLDIDGGRWLWAEPWVTRIGGAA